MTKPLRTQETVPVRHLVWRCWSDSVYGPQLKLAETRKGQADILWRARAEYRRLTKKAGTQAWAGN